MRVLPKLTVTDAVSEAGGWVLDRAVRARDGYDLSLRLPCGHKQVLSLEDLNDPLIDVIGTIAEPIVCTERHQSGQLCNFHDTVCLKDWIT